MRDLALSVNGEADFPQCGGDDALTVLARTVVSTSVNERGAACRTSIGEERVAASVGPCGRHGDARGQEVFLGDITATVFEHAR